MSYRLVRCNAENEFYSIDDEEWIRVLDEARRGDWAPEGTYLDFEYELDTMWDDMFSYDYRLLLTLTAHMRCLEWNGANYTDTENQIVSDNDAYNMYVALMYSDVDQAFLDFISAGGFRICQ